MTVGYNEVGHVQIVISGSVSKGHVSWGNVRKIIVKKEHFRGSMFTWEISKKLRLDGVASGEVNFNLCISEDVV